MAQSEPAAYQPKPFNPKLFGLKLGCAGAAGIIGVSLTFPLDRAKTLLQIADRNPHAVTRYTGVFNCLSVETRTNGFASLYKGLKPNLLGIVFEKGLKLGINDLVREQLADPTTGKTSVANGCVAGATAGLCQSIITTPMEYCKVQMQANPKLSLAALIARAKLTDYYRGYTATILRDVPFSIVFFALYGSLEQGWATDNTTGETVLWKVLLSGTFAGAVGAFISTPMDVIKSNLQSDNPRYTAIRPEALALYNEHGVAAFIRGWLPRCIAIGALFGVTLLSYRVQKDLMVKYKLDQDDK
eukprot:TRINITY_DN11641_c0_g1_i1.p1 TRINITY_DN11641_c0_g1~~TRINITY_DN11641_c0_g1_i1.p1  ORF type:complete len:300 (+),score=57.81 TRINITY_DN11641_c0_g1_i1:245-1144(+)